MYQFRIEGCVEDREVINKIMAFISIDVGCKAEPEMLKEFGYWMTELPEGPIEDFAWQCGQWADEYGRTSDMVDIPYAIREAVDDANYRNEPDVIAERVYEQLISCGFDSFEANRLVQSMIEECIENCKEGEEA